jgi:hypothetical protein
MLCESLEGRVLFAADPPTILFVRGATRSGGFLEGATVTPRDEQLADVNNTSTAAGNAGWGMLAAELRAAGFVIEQAVEAKEPGAPTSGFVEGKGIRFEALDLTKYAAIVFGSNNARYARASVDAVQNYVRNGGAALFISDANFGSTWRDAADSDQQFLAAYGLIVNQDAASGVTELTRAGGDFTAPSHPVLSGVNAISGEGVSPVVVPQTPPAGVTITSVVHAVGKTRNNDGANPANRFQGSLRDVTARDAALVLATAGSGRVAAYFDRNTFFNANGVGTDLTEFDNRRFALNLFRWLTDTTPLAVTNAMFKQGAPSEVRLTFNDNLAGSIARKDILLRNPFDGTPLARNRWGWEAIESENETVLIVRIKGAAPPGAYQLQINAGRLQDDAGNSNARVRFNFTIA